MFRRGHTYLNTWRRIKCSVD